MIHLRAISIKHGNAPSGGFPYSVPSIATLPAITLASPVTFFAGENGSGKSTLLEAIAAATGLPAVGSERIDADETLRAQRMLGRSLQLSWNRRTHRGFYLRAEDFFGFARSLARARDEFQGRLAEIDEEYRDRSPHAKALARGPAMASLGEMERRYGADPDARSHGQAFLQLFQSRFVPGGLYLLDEPEAPLSPQSQLGLIAMLKDMVAQDAQFVVATHSPILLAFPGARIFTFDDPPVRETSYEALEHVALTRDFLNDPARFLRRL